jgi:hypothetical protein
LQDKIEIRWSASFPNFKHLQNYTEHQNVHLA